jgi:hypothetical protein
MEETMDRRLRKTKTIAAALALMFAVAACDDGDTDPTDPVDDGGVTTTLGTGTTAAG